MNRCQFTKSLSLRQTLRSKRKVGIYLIPVTSCCGCSVRSDSLALMVGESRQTKPSLEAYSMQGVKDDNKQGKQQRCFTCPYKDQRLTLQVLSQDIKLYLYWARTNHRVQVERGRKREKKRQCEISISVAYFPNSKRQTWKI